MNKYKDEPGQNASRKAAAEELFDKLSDPNSKYYNWKIVDVSNQNDPTGYGFSSLTGEDSGFYAVTIETAEDNAIIGNSGGCNMTKRLNQIRGSLIGGAIGDALGYPIEFMTWAEIKAKYGRDGITSYELDPRSKKALISDDTQMSLFTADGVLVARTRFAMKGIGGVPSGYIPQCYVDWLYTQEMSKEEFDLIRFGEGEIDGVRTFGKENKNLCVRSWLCDVPELFSRRAPGNTCISAIRSGKSGSVKEPINNSKGCGGIMRVAPLGLAFENVGIKVLDYEGAEIAALTHGHSLGYMSAAVLTHIISRLVYPKQEYLESDEDSNNTLQNRESEQEKKRDSVSLKKIVLEARDTVHELFAEDSHIRELDDIITKAVSLSENEKSDHENIRSLGEGWVAEETLAIAIYCALRHQNSFSDGIIAAVNHDGDSDSTGAVTGNILGALLGFSAIDEKWTKDLELFNVLGEMAVDLYNSNRINGLGGREDREWDTKYIDMRWPKVLTTLSY